MKKESWHIHHWLFFGIYNGLIIYLLSLFLPGYIVLGNATVSVLAAIVLAALLVTAVISFFPYIFRRFSLEKMALPKKYLVYGVSNILIVWLLSRLATIFGFGLSSKVVAILLGVILTGGQYFFWEIGLKQVKKF